MQKQMKKFVLVAVLMLFAFSGAAQEGDYGEVKEILDEYIAVVEGLLSSIDKASNAREVAAMFNDFVDVVAKLSPRLETLGEKYPDLDDNTPEELEETMEKFEKSMESFTGVFEKLMPYMEDEEVQKAIKRLEEL